MLSNFPSVPTVLYQFLTCIALSDADLRFSLMLTKACVIEEETKWAAWLYHWCNQSIHLTEGVTVMSLPASHLQKISLHMNHQCKIAPNKIIVLIYSLAHHLCKFWIFYEPRWV